jgi:hypothetical protein
MELSAAFTAIPATASTTVMSTRTLIAFLISYFLRFNV